MHDKNKLKMQFKGGDNIKKAISVGENYRLKVS